MTQRIKGQKGEYLVTDETIGQGGISTVLKGFKVINDRKSDKVAIKKICKQTPYGQINCQYDQELEITQRLIEYENKDPCQYIMNIIDFSLQNGFYYIITQYYEHGDFFEFLEKKHEYFTYDIILDILIQIIKAIKYLHQHDIIHRDLKPENILIANENNQYFIKVADFGTATSSNKQQIAGTLNYMAPEILLKQHQTEMIDIWSFGCIAYEIITKKQFFSGSSMEQTVREIKAYQENKYKNQNPNDPYFRVHKIIKQYCLQKDPSKRQDALFIQNELAQIKQQLQQDLFESDLDIIKSNDVVFQSIEFNEAEIDVLDLSSLLNSHIQESQVKEIDNNNNQSSCANNCQEVDSIINKKQSQPNELEYQLQSSIQQVYAQDKPIEQQQIQNQIIQYQSIHEQSKLENLNKSLPNDIQGVINQNQDDLNQEKNNKEDIQQDSYQSKNNILNNNNKNIDENFNVIKQNELNQNYKLVQNSLEQQSNQNEIKHIDQVQPLQFEQQESHSQLQDVKQQIIEKSELFQINNQAQNCEYENIQQNQSKADTRDDEIISVNDINISYSSNSIYSENDISHLNFRQNENKYEIDVQSNNQQKDDHINDEQQAQDLIYEDFKQTYQNNQKENPQNQQQQLINDQEIQQIQQDQQLNNKQYQNYIDSNINYTNNQNINNDQIKNYEQLTNNENKNKSIFANNRIQFPFKNNGTMLILVWPIVLIGGIMLRGARK